MRSRCDRLVGRTCGNAPQAGQFPDQRGAAVCRGHRRLFGGTGSALLTLVLVLLQAGDATAAVETLIDGNSIATFHTEIADGPDLGLNQWSVNGVEHLGQQWFLYRIGEESPEHAIGASSLPNGQNDPLLHISTIPMNLNGQPGNDFLQVTYRDTETLITREQFEVQLAFSLAGGSAVADHADMSETIIIQNLGDSELDIHFFQYANFDLGGSHTDDTVVITGNPRDTATQNSPLASISETVVTPPPTHFEAGTVVDRVARFTDFLPTILTDDPGPQSGFDVAWAFQWDFTIGVGDLAFINKEKGLRPSIIPLPSAVYAGLTLLVSLGVVRRIRRRIAGRHE